MNEKIINGVCLALLFGFILWRFIKSLRNSDEPAVLLKKWGATLILLGILIPINLSLLKAGGYAAGFGLPIVTAAFAIPIGIIWAASWGEMLAAPLTNVFYGGESYNKPVPLYAIAEARRKRGRYQEAIDEVNQQLEKFPGDLTGALMLVDLYAKDLHQMAPAQEAVENYLDHGPHHSKNTFLALAHLADAYINHDSNREKASHCLERIQVLCEGTEQELIAAQRLAHLATEEQLQSKAQPKRIQLQQYDRRVGLRTTPLEIKRPEKSPEELATEYIKQLEAHPLDLETRENLALLYANHYQRLDMAIDQLETMVNFRNQSPRQIVKWLNQMADLHIRLAGSIPDAKACLERICHQFPNSAHEAQARKRMHFLGIEKKGRHS